ncbi:acyl-ACP--UDP-N-acetylglucosamine O-acyltransferase [Pararhizobium mangrovi]|uniref:Acyl-[acyl-carrier-protein]--UDP-N-acetylglucosamine O-acyltransferase n=1 Tax=Pararhizobium mangrovi TaxID=2590452 RepID=A0A506U9V7_9HYPH|nr:acyl-ACP--UDP-N-acetylglucosamine O-acyltransferase [Pararhizobium mangrovi]TPW31222.1 acyl-ACP--UDP-N-acetylglucosamine O-acyltransferase [Pararhizobium mangrovi]
MASASDIHPSAIIEPGAEIGADVRIGPFCHVGPKVRLGAGVDLVSHAVVTGNTSIGERTRIFPGAILGGEPQNVKYRGEDTRLVIGADCTIREGVTMNTGMPDAGGVTSVGDHSLFLAYSHVAHDCHVGDHVILSNNVMLAGHVSVGDRVIMGGGAAVHQFTRVGHHAFIGGLSAVSHDVIPYGMLNGNPGVLAGLNVIGMARNGMSKTEIHTVRRAFRQIFHGEGAIREKAAKLDGGADVLPAVRDILDFILTDHERALSSPARIDRP